MFENLKDMTNEELFAGMTALEAEMNRITVGHEKKKEALLLLKAYLT